VGAAVEGVKRNSTAFFLSAGASERASDSQCVVSWDHIYSGLLLFMTFVYVSLSSAAARLSRVFQEKRPDNKQEGSNTVNKSFSCQLQSMQQLPASSLLT
jgi:hypothetical protein